MAAPGCLATTSTPTTSFHLLASARRSIHCCSRREDKQFGCATIRAASLFGRFVQTAANSGTAELLRQLKMLLAQGGLPPDIQNAGALHYLGRVVYAQAYTMGFRDSFLLVAIIFTVGLIPAWIMGRQVARKEASAA